MTVTEYLAQVRRLRLHPCDVPNVYIDDDREYHSVPDPNEYTEEEREQVFNEFEAHFKLMKGY